MYGIASVILSGAAILLFVVVATLATPVRLGFSAQSRPNWRVMLSARLFGGLTPPLRIVDSARLRRRAEKPAPQSSKRSAKTTSFAGRGWRTLVAAPRLLVSLLRPFRLERLSIDADIGLSDPADTGQIVGMLTPLIFVVSRSHVVDIAIRPDFSGPGVEGELDADVSIVPAALIPPLAIFTWRVLRTQ